MYIIGAGTLGEIVLETAKRAGIEVSGFYDDTVDFSKCDGIPVLGRLRDFQNNENALAQGAFIAIGDNRNRHLCMQSLQALGVHFPNVIDPRATLSPTASLGHGNLILPGSYIGLKCLIGSGNLIFPGVSITHHNYVGDFCFFGPNVSVGGFTKIGNFFKVGMNCVVLPYQDLGSDKEYSPLTIVKSIAL